MSLGEERRLPVRGSGGVKMDPAVGAGAGKKGAWRGSQVL